MEKSAFTRVSLSNVRVIMTIMYVHVEELLSQAVTGHIPVLKYLLPGVCGCLWPCPVMSDIKCCRFPTSDTESPWVRLSGAWVCAKLEDEDLKWADKW
jgi:hypothetical protein